MDRKMDKPVHRRIDGWANGQTVLGMDGQTDALMDGWMDLMGGWMDGRRVLLENTWVSERVYWWLTGQMTQSRHRHVDERWLDEHDRCNGWTGIWMDG